MTKRSIVAAGAADAYSTTISAHKVAASHACHATQVTLHGSAAPTITCLDGKQGTGRTLPGGGIGPLAHLVYAHPCYMDSLAIYQDWNESGITLCLNGSGEINLNAYYGGYWWNDVAKSFWMGCLSALFYVDINLGGGSAFAPGSPYGQNALFGTFPYQNVGWNQLSSVYLIAGGTC